MLPWLESIVLYKQNCGTQDRATIYYEDVVLGLIVDDVVPVSLTFAEIIAMHVESRMFLHQGENRTIAFRHILFT